MHRRDRPSSASSPRAGRTRSTTADAACAARRARVGYTPDHSHRASMRLRREIADGPRRPERRLPRPRRDGRRRSAAAQDFRERPAPSSTRARRRPRSASSSATWRRLRLLSSRTIAVPIRPALRTIFPDAGRHHDELDSSHAQRQRLVNGRPRDGDQRVETIHWDIVKDLRTRRPHRTLTVALRPARRALVDPASPLRPARAPPSAVPARLSDCRQRTTRRRNRLRPGLEEARRPAVVVGEDAPPRGRPSGGRHQQVRPSESSSLRAQGKAAPLRCGRHGDAAPDSTRGRVRSGSGSRFDQRGDVRTRARRSAHLTLEERYRALLSRRPRRPDLANIRRILASPMEVSAYAKPDAIRALIDNPPAFPEPGWRAWVVGVWKLVTAECWLRFQAGGSFADHIRERALGGSAPNRRWLG